MKFISLPFQGENDSWGSGKVASGNVFKVTGSRHKISIAI